MTNTLQRTQSVAVVSRLGKAGKAIVAAGAIAALASATVPTTAHAGGNGVGAAIGLRVLSGVIAGAAIASSTPPAYWPAPAPAYDYPPQPYQGYYPAAPAYYYQGSQPYYGWNPYYR